MRKQTDDVIVAMRNNGGYATLGQLNELIDFSCWKTKTPQASVRRIVQQSGAFFKIQPGLWALEENKDAVLRKFKLTTNDNEKELFTHSYYQGIIVEIGNMRKLQTYVPPQDKNNLFIEKPLKDLVALDTIHEFTYPEILRRAKTVDVVWFNKRKLPHSFFEVEHSTDIQNSLTKFYELQDYNARFFIIAPDFREKKFNDIINRSVFGEIKERVKFVDYDNIVNQYSRELELLQMRKSI